MTVERMLELLLLEIYTTDMYQLPTQAYSRYQSLRSEFLNSYADNSTSKE
jgi:hypothetical protein